MSENFIGKRNLLGPGESNTAGVWAASEINQMRHYDFITGIPISGFYVSPTIDGKSLWDLENDGDLNLTSGSYVLIPTFSGNVSIKMWGQGGYNETSGFGGAGAALTGTLKVSAGEKLNVYFAGAGIGGEPTSNSGNGGNFAGIFLGEVAYQNNVIALAAGGGGSPKDDSQRGADGGNAGYPAGANATGYNTNVTGKGATQSAGGAGGTGNQGSNGTSGSALQGGNGGGSAPNLAGGGGGGYFGGGGGAMICCTAGGGGGGGSSYHSNNENLIESVTHYSASGSDGSAIPGNNNDSERNGAGSINGGTARIIFKLN